MVVILLVRADQTARNEKRGGAVGAMRQPARSDRPVRADPGLGQDGWALADNDKGGGVVRLKPTFSDRLGACGRGGRPGDGSASGQPTSGGQSAYDRVVPIPDPGRLKPVSADRLPLRPAGDAQSVAQTVVLTPIPGAGGLERHGPVREELVDRHNGLQAKAIL